jgi:glyceraldehyde-3-phosphate dehydrogenase/erythrose-4-phosphate dehydrogenase
MSRTTTSKWWRLTTSLKRTLADLLRYDSVFGRFPGGVTAGEERIAIDGAPVPRRSSHSLPTAWR